MNGGPGSGNPNPGQGRGIGKPGGGTMVSLSTLENAYKGDYKKAVSIWGKEYKDAIKNFDTSNFTEEEVNMVLGYASSPSIGNSYEKNSYWRDTMLIERKDGEPMSEEEYEKIFERYKEADRIMGWDERKKAIEKLESEGYIKTDNYFPQHSKNLVMYKEDILDKSLINSKDYHDKCKEIIDNAPKDAEKDWAGWYKDEKLKAAQSYLKNWDEAIEKSKTKINPDLSDWQKESLQQDIDFSKELISGKRKVKNYLDYPYSGDNVKTVSYEDVSKIPASKLDSLIEKYDSESSPYGFSIHKVLNSEKRGREFNDMINEKGISFDKDIVVSRRVNDTSTIHEYEKKYGYYEQLGFTSTTAANNVAKSSGNMKFGDNLLKIVIPAGTKVLPVEAFIKQRGDANDKSLQDLSKQHEILLPTNTKFISGDYTSHLTSIPSDSWNDKRSEFDSSLELDKVDTNHNTLYSYVAITPKYLEENS